MLIVEDVDDAIYAGNDDYENAFIKKIKESYSFGNEYHTVGGFKYKAGANARQSAEGTWKTLVSRSVTVVSLEKRAKDRSIGWEFPRSV